MKKRNVGDCGADVRLWLMVRGRSVVRVFVTVWSHCPFASLRLFLPRTMCAHCSA